MKVMSGELSQLPNQLQSRGIRAKAIASQRMGKRGDRIRSTVDEKRGPASHLMFNIGEGQLVN